MRLERNLRIKKFEWNVTLRDMSIAKSHVFYYGGGDVYDRNLKGNCQAHS